MLGPRVNSSILTMAITCFICTFVVSASAHTVSGVITFQDCNSKRMIDVTVVCRNVHDGSLNSQVLNVSTAGGAYTFTGLSSGIWDITFTASHWLRGLVKDVDVHGDVSLVNVSLVNGDANRDGTVDSRDSVLITKARLSSPGSNRWNADADLNGDGSIESKDCLIATRNNGIWSQATGACQIADDNGYIAPIILSPAAKIRLNAVATELQGFIGQVTGTPPPIKTTREATRGIIIGKASDFPWKASKENLSTLGPDGFRISAEQDRIWILANTDMGVQNGIYAFLEDDDIGCRWYFPDPAWTIIPSKPILKVDATQTSRAAYDYRGMWYEGDATTPTAVLQNFYSWMKHNRMYGSFGVETHHAYVSYMSPSLYSTHPEYFALINGERRPPEPWWMPCTGNTGVQQKMVDGVLNEFDKNPNKNMVSMEPNDSSDDPKYLCQCSLCTPLGNARDRIFRIANITARAVSQKRPGKWVGLLGYSYHSSAPSFNLEPNVFVQLSTGYNYSGLSITDRVNGFRARGAKVGIYDYVSGMAWYYDKPGLSIGSRTYRFANDIKTYRDLQATTYSSQMSCNWGATGLGCWMSSKLFWDPHLYPQILAQDFYTRAFKNAAAPMSQIYERWAVIGDTLSPATNDTLDAALRPNLKSSLNDMLAAYNAESDPQVTARLDQMAMYLHWLRLCLDYDTIKNGSDNAAVVNAAHNVIAYTRRIQDTGLIHSSAYLHQAYRMYWLDSVFSRARTISGDNWESSANAWIAEGQAMGVPTAVEAHESLVDDYNTFTY